MPRSKTHLFRVLLSAFILSPALCFSATVDVASELKISLKGLKKKDGVMVSVKKTSTNLTMGKTKETSGQLVYWKGKLRLQMDPPDQTLLVMDGKNLWLESKFTQEGETQVIVTKASLKGLKKANALWATILGNNDLLKEFKIKLRKKTGKQINLELVPKSTKESEIQKLTLNYTLSPAHLSSLTYLDDRENEVVFHLGDPDDIKGDAKTYFIYEPPKGANITEL